MPFIRDAHLPPTTPNRPSTPVVPLRQSTHPQHSDPAPMRYWRGAQPGVDPFVDARGHANDRAIRPAFVLPPPRTPQGQTSRIRAERDGMDVAAAPEPRNGDRPSFSHMARRPVWLGPPTTPTSPSPVAYNRTFTFVPFGGLPIMYVSQEVWKQEECRIWQEPLAHLAEPVGVQVYEALHIFDYADLQRWLRDPKNIRLGPTRFLNPVNFTWTPMTDLKRIRPVRASSPVAHSQHGDRAQMVRAPQTAATFTSTPTPAVVAPTPRTPGPV